MRKPRILKHAGKIKGPADLSARTGFTRKSKGKTVPMGRRKKD